MCKQGKTCQAVLLIQSQIESFTSKSRVLKLAAAILDLLESSRVTQVQHFWLFPDRYVVDHRTIKLNNSKEAARLETLE